MRTKGVTKTGLVFSHKNLFDRKSLRKNPPWRCGVGHASECERNIVRTLQTNFFLKKDCSLEEKSYNITWYMRVPLYIFFHFSVQFTVFWRIFSALLDFWFPIPTHDLEHVHVRPLRIYLNLAKNCVQALYERLIFFRTCRSCRLIPFHPGKKHLNKLRFKPAPRTSPLFKPIHPFIPFVLKHPTRPGTLCHRSAFFMGRAFTRTTLVRGKVGHGWGPSFRRRKQPHSNIAYVCTSTRGKSEVIRSTDE